MEVKTDDKSQPVSFESSCAEKRIGLNINKDFATLFTSELIAGCGAHLLKEHGQTEGARKIQERIMERRKSHKFGGTMDKIDEVVGNLADGLIACLKDTGKEGENKEQ